MAALLLVTGHGIKATTHACVEIAHFRNWCIIRMWKAVTVQPHASQALIMYVIGKYAISRHGFLLYLHLGRRMCCTFD